MISSFMKPNLNTMADSLIKSDLKGLDITRKDYQDFLEYAMGDEESKDLKDDISNIRKYQEDCRKNWPIPLS